MMKKDHTIIGPKILPFPVITISCLQKYFSKNKIIEKRKAMRNLIFHSNEIYSIQFNT